MSILPAHFGKSFFGCESLVDLLFLDAHGKIGEVVFVAFTERKEKIRLIFARLATAKERRFYYGNGDFTAEGPERTF